MPARLLLEPLECRVVPSAWLHDLWADIAESGSGLNDVQATIVAGDPNGSPGDSPANRVDPNTTSSPFGGVGSLQINTRRGTYICTATPISLQHILTAGHCVDINNDGKSNSKDGIRSIYFILNFGGNQTHAIRVSQVAVHPDFTGFNRPSVNDDISVLTLSSSLPASVPAYRLPTSDLAAATTVTMLGYGRSGDGVNGYYVNASFSVKRRGENSADAFLAQDDAGKPAANEVFRFDFDGPSGNGTFGGPSLGNDRETQLGGGDSGGPSLVNDGLGYVVVGVNTFSQGAAPYFGSLGGGMNVFAYVGFINSVTGAAPASASQTSDTNGSDEESTKKPAGSAEVTAVVEALAEIAVLAQPGHTPAPATIPVLLQPVLVVMPPTPPPATLPNNGLTTISSARFSTGRLSMEAWSDDADAPQQAPDAGRSAPEDRIPATPPRGAPVVPVPDREVDIPRVPNDNAAPGVPAPPSIDEEPELRLLPIIEASREPYFALAAAFLFAGCLREMPNPEKKTTLRFAEGALASR